MITVLGEIGELQQGYQLRSAVNPDPDGQFALVRLGDARRNADWSTLPRMDLERSATRSMIGAGDVLCRSRGGNYETCVAQDIDGTTIALAPLFIFRPDQTRVLPGYVSWWLNRPESQAALAAMAVGTSMQSIPIGAFRDFAIPLLTLEQQSRMVAIYDLNSKIESIESEMTKRRNELVQRTLEALATNLLRP